MIEDSDTIMAGGMFFWLMGLAIAMIIVILVVRGRRAKRALISIFSNGCILKTPPFTIQIHRIHGITQRFSAALGPAFRPRFGAPAGPERYLRAVFDPMGRSGIAGKLRPSA